MKPQLGQIVEYHFADTETTLDGIRTTRAMVANVHGEDLVDVLVGNSFKSRVSRGHKPSDPLMKRRAWSEIPELV